MAQALKFQIVTPGFDRLGRKSSQPGAVLLVGNFVPASSSYGSVGHELACRLEYAGWRALRTSYQKRKSIKLIDMVHTCWAARNRFEVAHVELYSGNAFLWAEVVCAVLRRLGKPYILALHGGNLPNFIRERSRRARRLLESAFAVVSPSPYLKEALSVFRPDIELIPNALDLDRYPGHVRRTAQPRIIWLRAFRAMYAPEAAVTAFANIVSDFAEARLMMIGPDRRDGSLQQAMSVAGRLGILDRVTFITGVPKPEVAAYLNTADIFLNTSTIDNSPVSVVEALACGLCVVSTNVGGIGHLLQSEVDSLLVPAGNSEALSAAVRRILTEQGLSAKLSENALHKAKTFDWSIVLPRWQRLLLSARPSGLTHREENRSHASVD